MAALGYLVMWTGFVVFFFWHRRPMALYLSIALLMVGMVLVGI